MKNFYTLESQKRYARALAKDTSIQNHLIKIKSDQESRMEQLRVEQDASCQNAQATELLWEDVDKVLTVTSSALGSGIDWEELENLVRVE